MTCGHVQKSEPVWNRIFQIHQCSISDGGGSFVGGTRFFVQEPQAWRGGFKELVLCGLWPKKNFCNFLERASCPVHQKADVGTKNFSVPSVPADPAFITHIQHHIIPSIVITHTYR